MIEEIRMVKDSIKEVSGEEAFGTLIQQGVTVVDFFAAWCGPCKMLSPILADVAKELSGSGVKFAKLDIDTKDNYTIAGEYEVTSVPTLVLFKDGQEVGRLVGLCDRADVKKFALSASR